MTPLTTAASARIRFFLRSALVNGASSGRGLRATRAKRLGLSPDLAPFLSVFSVFALSETAAVFTSTVFSSSAKVELLSLLLMPSMLADGEPHTLANQNDG